MTVVTVHYAKTNLSKLLEQVANGEEVVIARGKTPVAKLTALEPARKKRVPGRWKDVPGFGFSESFFDPLPDDELRLWNGEGD
jgi:antitoxin (DNA-binding transcriptional repressor) of toxin-antitoxin stability system